jgi:hypothetical protein
MHFVKVEFITLRTAKSAETAAPVLALEQSWKLDPKMPNCVGLADDPATYIAPFVPVVRKLEKLHADTFTDDAPSTCTMASVLYIFEKLEVLMSKRIGLFAMI